MPSVSIALATHNGETYLAAQLESLARQTRLPAELVVCDDASADGTKDVILDFSRRAPFPVHFHVNERRLGYRENFMRAAGLCRSDLIAFCDQDDIWEPEKISVMMEPFRDPDVCLAYHNATVTDKDGRPLGHFYPELSAVMRFAPLTLNPWCLVPGFTQMFRRTLSKYFPIHVASIDPYWPTERLAHDQWYLFLASVLGCIVQISRPLVRYRQHGANAFGWSNEGQLVPEPRYVLGNDGFIAAARNRTELSRRLQDQSAPQEQSRVRAAVAYYDALHERLRGRRSVYDSPSLAARALAVHALLKQGAYQSAQSATGYGWRGLLLDVCAGVPLGARSKRLVFIGGHPPHASPEGDRQ